MVELVNSGRRGVFFTNGKTYADGFSCGAVVLTDFH